MAILKHEVWVTRDGRPGCCLAGPDGDGARRLFAGDGATLAWTFEAGSHFEAMTKYNAHVGYESYSTGFPQDHEPYPDEWLAVQKGR
jgi:hypothetical protein